MEQGYFATTIPQIVKRAQVSTGSIYHHFKDKQTLAEAVINQLLHSIEQALDQLATHCDNSMANIQAVIHWMLDQATAHSKTIRFILYAQHQEFLPHLPPLCTQAPFEKMRELVLQA